LWGAPGDDNRWVRGYEPEVSVDFYLKYLSFIRLNSP
jgi:hypothetical protein